MSAAPKFVPGPWKVCAVAPNEHWFAGVTIHCDVPGGRRVCDVRGYAGALPGEFPEQEATARLIAAAPELHEAALAAIAYDAAIEACANDPASMSSHCTAQGDDLDTLYDRWISKARAALAKVDA